MARIRGSNERKAGDNGSSGAQPATVAEAANRNVRLENWIIAVGINPVTFFTPERRLALQTPDLIRATRPVEVAVLPRRHSSVFRIRDLAGEARRGASRIWSDHVFASAPGAALARAKAATARMSPLTVAMVPLAVSDASIPAQPGPNAASV